MFDVIIVGGGTAGLSAALVLGRARRRVLVLDGGPPRNMPSHAAHGFFTRDGTSPAELLRLGREQLQPYDSVEVRAAEAIGAERRDGRFEVTLADGHSARARKLLLATGVFDELPAMPGFRELWGRGVYHCPYCHGWEVRDRPLAMLARGPLAVVSATMLCGWSRDLVLLTDGPSGLDEAGRERLRGLGVPVREERITSLEGDPSGGGLARVVFEDGSTIEREGLFHAPPQRQRSGLAASLGCEIVEAGPLPARVVQSDPVTRETTVAGVFVAGDALSPLQSVVMAAASGANAAYFINHALAVEDADEEIAVATATASAS